MLNNIDIAKILFLDIETVPQYKSYDEIPERFKELWDRKCIYLAKKEEDTPDILYERAGIYAEFGRIICISVGYFSGVEFRLKSFFGDDEKLLLEEFASLLNRYYSYPDQLLCAHNGKEFDFPYIARRMLINGVELPVILDSAGKKPWEVRHLDTMELWKFGDFKNYTSLNLLTAVFDIPTPKDDIDGSQVARVYYDDNNLERIVEYCQKDTISVAQILLKYMGKPLIKDDHIQLIA